jgi:uracil-DNA glycosylase family 4
MEYQEIPGWQNKEGKVELLIIGERPGVTGSNINKRPLSTSNSGKVLWKALRELKYDHKVIYITNLVKRAADKNRSATLAEAKRDFKTLQDEIKSLKPEAILILGRNTLKLLLKLGFWHHNYRAIFHPSAVFHSLHFSEFKDDLKDALNFLFSNIDAIAMYSRKSKKFKKQNTLRRWIT